MSKHAPARWQTYLATHENWMSRLYSEGFIQRDSLQWRGIPNTLFLEGQIACLGGLIITVEKVLDVSGPAGGEIVQTVRYNYNLSVQGKGNVMRRDNAEHHGFVTPHHRHTFDWKRDREDPNSPFHVGEEGWVTLGEAIREAIREAAEWYYANREALPDPSGTATIDDVYVARNSHE